MLDVIKHIERMGDQCVNVAKMVPLAGHEPPRDLDILQAIDRMAAQAKAQVLQAQQAFRSRDVDLAEDLVRQDDEILAKVERMGVLARSEVSQSKQAFLLRDVALAEDLVRQDEEINQLNKEIFARAVEVGTDPDVREWAMTMMLMARAVERIGDNAVDIGEQVAFVVTGLFREFSDASRT